MTRVTWRWYLAGTRTCVARRPMASKAATRLRFRLISSASWRRTIANLNIELYPGDRVTVERAGVVYVVGAVNHPGGFVLTSQHQPMTVLKALALAEDLKPTARGNDALIIPPKTSGPGNAEGLPVRVKDILARKAADQPLHAGEILFVPDVPRQTRRAAGG